MHKKLYDLVGKEVKHKKYGMCKVVEVIDEQEFKIAIETLEDSTLRKVLFSSNYFEDVDEYESLELPEYVRKEKRVYRKPDMSKYRRHPLVKAIDGREQGIRVRTDQAKDNDDNEDDED